MENERTRDILLQYNAKPPENGTYIRTGGALVERIIMRMEAWNETKPGTWSAAAALKQFPVHGDQLFGHLTKLFHLKKL
jgi:hypothetical protein